MTVKEFSEQFDTMLDSHKLRNEYGFDENLFVTKLDEYEKSVYLTKAQNSLVTGLYTGRGEIPFSYEQTEELRRYLSSLNKTVTVENGTSLGDQGLSETSKKFIIGDDVLYITQEQCQIDSEGGCENNTWIAVSPIKRIEYNTIKNNPFKNNKVWRVDNEIGEVELISKHSIKKYQVSYVRKPAPIILEDLDYLTIEGVSTQSECELHSALHFFILELAVINALRYMSSDFPQQEDTQEEEE